MDPTLIQTFHFLATEVLPHKRGLAALFVFQICEDNR